MNYLIHASEARIRPLRPHRCLPNPPPILAIAHLLLDKLEQSRHQLQGNMLELTRVEFDCLQGEESRNDFVSNLLPFIFERIDASKFILMCMKITIFAIVQRYEACMVGFSNALKASMIAKSKLDEILPPAFDLDVVASHVEG